MIHYLLIGLGVYLCAFAGNPESFKNASVVDILSGILLGFLLWPLALVVVYIMRDEKKGEQ